MKAFTFFAIFTLLLAVNACQPKLNINTDYDDLVDFSSFKTYRWHQRNQHNHMSKDYLGNDIMEQRIRSNINQQLTAKGFREIAGTEPVDFLVNYSILVENRADIRSYNTYNGYAPGFRYGMGYGRYGSSMAIGYSGGTDTRVIEYQQGTLIIDILNPETDKLIWRVSGDGRLPKKQTQQERVKMIQEVVAELLKDFPPKPKK